MELRKLEEKVKELIDKYGRLAEVETFSNTLEVYNTSGEHVETIKM